MESNWNVSFCKSGEVLFHYNTTTHEVKWPHVHMADCSVNGDMSKQIPDQLQCQTSLNFDILKHPQPENLHNLEDIGTPFLDHIEPTDECSNLIREECPVTVVLEPCSDSDEKAESTCSSSVIMDSKREMAKATCKQNSSGAGSSLGITDSGKRKAVLEQLYSEKNSDMKHVGTIDTKINNVTMISRDTSTEGTGEELASDNQPTALFTPDTNDVEDNHHVHKEGNITGNRTAYGERIQAPQPEKAWYKDHCSKCFKRCSIGVTQLETNSDDKVCKKCFRKSHGGTDLADKPYKCPHCERWFSYPSKLACHVRIHTGERPFKCNQCGKCFKNANHLTKHLQMHSGEKPFKCNYCKKCFSQSSYLTTHVRTHTGEKPFKCKHCEKCFTQSSYLTQHIRKHSGERPFKCKQCDKCFSYAGSLASHVRTHSGEKARKIFECSVCRKCFKTKSNLVNHLRTHCEENPFKCEQCEKCFRKCSQLTCHMQAHSRQKPHKCKRCTKSYSTLTCLARHVYKIHSKVKTCKCRECGKSFKTNSTLAAHVRIHSGEKPYKCEKCRKFFRHLNTFTRHSLIHSGEKPYKCKQCGECFRHGIGLAKHFQTHTGEVTKKH